MLSLVLCGRLRTLGLDLLAARMAPSCSMALTARCTSWTLPHSAPGMTSPPMLRMSAIAALKLDRYPPGPFSVKTSDLSTFPAGPMLRKNRASSFLPIGLLPLSRAYFSTARASNPDRSP